MRCRYIGHVTLRIVYLHYLENKNLDESIQKVVCLFLETEAPAVLPQSRSKQPAESQELLEQVANVIEMPQNDSLTLLEAGRYAAAHCHSSLQSRRQRFLFRI